MHIITQSCVLFFWLHILSCVKSQDCTLEQFLNGPLFDLNFDTTDLAASYPGGKQVRVNCNVGYGGFFKLICAEGKWQSKGTKCQPKSCGHPGDAQFADFQLERGDDFVFGSQVVYICHKGYQMVSRVNHRRCMAEGWDGLVPVCEAQQCPVIHVDANINVIGDPEEATYGNVLRFSCKLDNHVLYGSSEMYCDENGVWNGQDPKCREISCSVPNITNGDVNGDKQEYKNNDVLLFTCRANYKKTQAIPSKCVKQGIRAEWTPRPECEPVVCRLPLRPTAGTRFGTSQNQFSPGDSVRVFCGERYLIANTQEAEITCKQDGEWTIPPVCQVITCSGRRPAHVATWSTGWDYNRIYTLDDTKYYTCDRGYKRTSVDNMATCTREGWKPYPLCKVITCNSEYYENSEIVGDDHGVYTYNQGVRYACRTGYRGQFTMTCREQGWTGNPQCTKITCNSQYYQNAEIDGDDRRVYMYNEEVQYTCTNGYRGSFTLTCGDSGWIGSPQCTVIRCNKLHIDNAQITGREKESYNHRERVQYRCQTGDAKVFTIACEQNGWTGIQTCSACPNARVPHGLIVGPYNDTLYYTCQEGYKLFTNGWWAEAKCDNGMWSGLEQCIENTTCGEIPEIPNGKVTPPRRNSQKARITCFDGYSPQVNQLTCSEGIWLSNGLSPSEICTPTAVPCSPPPKVDNAIIVHSYQKEYLSDTTVTYQCRDTYTLVGEDTIVCRDGIWEKKDISCQAPALQ